MSEFCVVQCMQYRYRCIQVKEICRIHRSLTSCLSGERPVKGKKCERAGGARGRTGVVAQAGGWS